MEDSKVGSVVIKKDKKFKLLQVSGPFLDIALKKHGLRLDWAKFCSKFFDTPNIKKIYYHFEYFKEDFRGVAYINKLESLGFEVVTRRLPPLQRDIVKERIAAEMSVDLSMEVVKMRENIQVIILCPFIDLLYGVLKARELGAKVTLMDFSEPPSQLVAEASELIILSERDNIFMDAKKKQGFAE